MNRYQQLAEKLKQQIKDNTWRAGEKIPSLRAASQSFSVSSATVLQAYQLLESQGWIKAKPQSGYFVTSTIENSAMGSVRPAVRSEYNDELYEFLKSNNQASVAFGSAFPDPSLFPLQALNRHLASAGRKTPVESVIRNLPPGNETLRRMIAQRYIMQGVAVSHEDIVLTSGAMEALNLSLQVVCEPGDTVVIETPTFYGALQAVERLKLNVVQVPVNPATGVDLSRLEQAFSQHDVKACWLMASFQNPTGASLNDACKRSVVELANQYDVYVIEDDVYAELHLEDRKPYPLKYWDERDRVLLCSSLSKSLCPGYRIGWVVNRTLSDKLQKQQLTSTLATSSPIQQGVAHYLQYESYDNHLRKLRKHLSRRQIDYLDAIEQCFPKTITVRRPRGGYFLWLELDKVIDTYFIYQKLKKSDISIAYGNLFAADNQFQNYLRINISFELTDTVRDALKEIAQLVAKPPNC
ncbi:MULTISPECIES: aminotransferase-like domain-containing protein [Vibrio]|uniref:PLP-dependent aminotransferase family protein n=1 Tax=Vibrio bivalvicida TaxID=1276888 RepID=A0ABV4MJ71_9VIBR|nr:PLP-dependent aminotransferase family protein [Vibrio sp. VPAP30]KLN64778.1 GntR family transcriptional regulator [Vibrio sp. VPAP30]